MVLFQGDIVAFSVKLLVPGKTPFAGNVVYLAKNGNMAWGEQLSARRVSPEGAHCGVLLSTREPPRLQADAWHWAVLGLTEHDNITLKEHQYAHLKELNHKPWIIAALVSWGIALLEYLFQVPANRVGYTVLSIGQLKIMQEVITLSVFVPFALLYLKEPLKLDYLWAGLCLLGAVYFMFRDRIV